MLLERYRKACAPPTDWPEITIDLAKCTSCGLCAKVCPADLITMDDKNGPPVLKSDKWRCIACGNCTSLCKVDAINWTGAYRVLEGRYKNTDTTIDGEGTWPQPFGDGNGQIYDDYAENLTETERTIFQRRSVRLFQDKQVPKELIERIIEAARFAPSGANAQPWKFVVVQDPKTLNLVKSRIKIFLKLATYGMPYGKEENFNPPLHKKIITGLASLLLPNILEPRIALAFESFLLPRNDIWHNAPTVIFALYDKRCPGFPELDTALAVENLVLAADAVGLSTCLGGLAIMPLNWVFKGVARKVGIKGPFKLVVTVMLGYPAYQMNRAVRREPARIEWIT